MAAPVRGFDPGAMTNDHVGRVGWAGYLRKPVCACGWEGRRQKEVARAEADLARHLAAQQPSTRLGA